MTIVQPQRCVVIGGGGHSSVIIDLIMESEVVEPAGILDRNRMLSQSHVLGVPIIGGDDYLKKLSEEGITCFIVGLGSTGNTTARERLYKQATDAGLKAITLVHPSAYVSKHANIGPGSVVLAMAVVSTRATLGKNVIINSGSIIEHGCQIGDHVHVATGAKLAGDIRVGNGVHIGAGAVLKEGIKIGSEAIIGAGSAVINDIKPKMTVFGVPAGPANATNRTQK